MRVDLRIHSIGLGLVSVESHNRELLEVCQKHIGNLMNGSSTHSLNLTRINLNNTNTAGDQLLSQALREAADCGLGGAVDGTTGVGLPAGNGADVDDIAVTSVGAGKEDGKNGLSHVDEAGDVGVEHDANVLLGDLGSPSDALHETAMVHELLIRAMSGKGDLRIVNEDVNVPPLLGQVAHKALDLGGVAHVELKGQHLDTITNLALDLVSELLE